MSYLIFGGQCYYAMGGIHDLLDTASDLEAGCKRAQELLGLKAVTCVDEDGDGFFDQGHEIEWTHVFCLTDRKIVAKFGKEPYGAATVLHIRPFPQ